MDDRVAQAHPELMPNETRAPLFGVRLALLVAAATVLVSGRPLVVATRCLSFEPDKSTNCSSESVTFIDLLKWGDLAAGAVALWLAVVLVLVLAYRRRFADRDLLIPPGLGVLFLAVALWDASRCHHAGIGLAPTRMLYVLATLIGLFTAASVAGAYRLPSAERPLEAVGK